MSRAERDMLSPLRSRFVFQTCAMMHSLCLSPFSQSARLTFGFEFCRGDGDMVMATSQQNHFSVADNDRALRQRGSILTGHTEPSGGDSIARPLGKSLPENLHFLRGYLGKACEFVRLPNKTISGKGYLTRQWQITILFSHTIHQIH